MLNDDLHFFSSSLKADWCKLHNGIVFVRIVLTKTSGWRYSWTRRWQKQTISWQVEPRTHKWMGLFTEWQKGVLSCRISRNLIPNLNTRDSPPSRIASRKIVSMTLLSPQNELKSICERGKWAIQCFWWDFALHLAAVRANRVALRRVTRNPSESEENYLIFFIAVPVFKTIAKLRQLHNAYSWQLIHITHDGVFFPLLHQFLMHFAKTFFVVCLIIIIKLHTTWMWCDVHFSFLRSLAKQ